MAALLLTTFFIVKVMTPAFTRMGIAPDSREHVFWTARFHNPELFSGDLMADYFQAVSPPGYNALYWALTTFIDPFMVSRLLPPILGLATAAATFLLVRRLHPAPPVAFVASVLVSWFFWNTWEIVPGSQHAFMPPILGALLTALAARRRLLGVGLVALGAAFYPAAGLTGLALLGVRLVSVRDGRRLLTRERSAWLALVSAVTLVVAVLLPTILASARFGPTVTAAQAQSMPEFGPNGRRPFFTGSWYQYWIASAASGLTLDLTERHVQVFLGAAALLPILLLFRKNLSAVRRVRGESIIAFQLLVASLGLFVLAHLVLFRLHLPSRYVNQSLPFVLAIASALTFGILFETIGARLARGRGGLALSGGALALGLFLVAVPPAYPADFIFDRHPEITAYLRAQPENILVAGVPLDTDSIPAFGQRSVLTSRKHALPYHLGYYAEMRRRTEALLDAYYAESAAEVADFAARYGVDIFVVNEAAFDRRRLADLWNGGTGGEPFTSMALRKVGQSHGFALQNLARRCAVVRSGAISLVPASCLSES